MTNGERTEKIRIILAVLGNKEQELYRDRKKGKITIPDREEQEIRAHLSALREIRDVMRS